MDAATASLFKWISDSSINELVHFHNDIRNMIKGHYSDSEDQEASQLNRTLETYAETLATSCFLLLYARTEETLIDLWKIRLRKKPPPSNGIDRHKELFRDVGLDIGTYEPWDELQDASKVRHCLLHANGRIDLMRNPTEITAVAERTEGIRITDNRIYVGTRYLDSFSKALRQLRDDLVRVTQ